MGLRLCCAVPKKRGPGPGPEVGNVRNRRDTPFRGSVFKSFRHLGAFQSAATTQSKLSDPDHTIADRRNAGAGSPSSICHPCKVGMWHFSFHAMRRSGLGGSKSVVLGIRIRVSRFPLGEPPTSTSTTHTHTHAPHLTPDPIVVNLLGSRET
jgi:hypothetical protein